MSLSYDLSAIKDRKVLVELNWPITHRMIYTTMGVGMGEITEDNYVEFTVRQEIMAYLDRYEPYTTEQVKLYIGLKTNVTTESRLEFLKRVVNRSMDDRLYTLKREQSEEKN